MDNRFEKIIKIDPLLKTKFINVYDTTYEDGSHWYTASRRKKDDLCALKSDVEYQRSLPDAVSVFVILLGPAGSGDDPVVLLQNEFRHPIGRYGLSVPAGIIDPEDKTGLERDEVLIKTAKRELFEETNLDVDKQQFHKEWVINPEAASTPGFTDESNGLVCIVCSKEGSTTELNHSNAEATEHFGNFVLMNHTDTLTTITSGQKNSLMVTADLLYFVSGIWQYQLM